MKEVRHMYIHVHVCTFEGVIPVSEIRPRQLSCLGGSVGRALA